MTIFTASKGRNGMTATFRAAPKGVPPLIENQIVPKR